MNLAGNKNSHASRLFFSKLRLCLLFFVLLAPALPAQNIYIEGLGSSFALANKLYEEGKYPEASAAYDKILGNGNASEAIYFNRGNALFKQGQIGRAIASWRLARTLAPRDPDVRANLQLARTRARGGTPYQSERWRGLFDKLTLNEWTTLLVLAFWLLFILLALVQWRPGLKPALRNYLFGAGAAVILFGVCFLVALNTDYLTSSAIVISGEVDIRNGPLDESPSIFKVRDGVELTIVDRINGWLQVADPVQRTGWVRGDQVLILNHGVEQKPGA
jgi:tetratricopeptide (TPR) repeat protein